jgi:hypothetical protein
LARPVTNNKLTFKEALNTYSKEYISNLYCNKSISTAQLAKELNVGRSVFYKLLNYYNFEKEPLYYGNSFDLLLSSIDHVAFEADLPIIGYKGALEKYKINRTQFYRICDRLGLDYKTLIKPVSGNKHREYIDAMHERRLSEISLEKVKETYLAYGFCGTLQELNLSRKTLEYYLRTYGKDIRELKNNNSNNSYYNNLFTKYLVERNIPFEREFKINKKRFDFKIGNLLIEINPSRTHSLDGRNTRYSATSFLYHQEKSLLALENNFSIVHLYQNNNMLEFIEKYLEQSFKITSKLSSDTLYINLEDFCTLEVLKAEVEKFTYRPKRVIITESLNFCTLNLNQCAAGKVLPPQIFYIKDETIISAADYEVDDKAYCLSDAGKIVWTLGGDELNEIFSD